MYSYLALQGKRRQWRFYTRTDGPTGRQRKGAATVNSIQSNQSVTHLNYGRYSIAKRVGILEMKLGQADERGKDGLPRGRAE